MTREQFDNHFNRIPGAWCGVHPRYGIGQITVAAAECGDAIDYLNGYGFDIVSARVSPHFNKRPDLGIQLKVR